MKHKWIPAALAAAVVLFLITAGLFAAELARLLQPLPPESPGPTEPPLPDTAGTELAGPDYYLPQALFYGMPLPEVPLSDASGAAAGIIPDGRKTILLWWGSWCPWCKEQLAYLDEFLAAAQEQDLRLILLNKTDPDKEESPEKAETFLAENGWSETEHYCDIGLNAYRAWGMRRIPTVIVLDGDGYVRAMASDVLEGRSALDALLEEADRGGTGPLLQFIREHMLRSDGGMYMDLLPDTSRSPGGHDTLSESMGLLMECAVRLGDRELFEQSYRYVREKLARSGLYAWYCSDSGRPGSSNALLDDLRIASALLEADALWGGFQKDAEDLSHLLLVKNSYRGKPASFYDFRLKTAGSSISLAYCDLAELDTLARLVPGLAGARSSLEQILLGGYLGDDFPLFAASYDYRAQAYSSESLHTAEALLTLYHLSRAGLLPSASLTWLKDAVSRGSLAARYNTDGSVPAGCRYRSTAVYAIAALIGAEEGDPVLYRDAVSCMELSRVSDPASPWFGAFSQTDDGSDISAFDLLLPLLVYSSCRNIRFA